MLDDNAALKCARLSQQVYQDFASIRFAACAPDVKVTLIESKDIGDTRTDTQVAVLYEPTEDTVFVVFRGTEKGLDWINNVQFRQQVYPYGDDSSTDVRFHRGFMEAYLAVRDRVLDVVRQYPKSPITVTGHSLGGALATIGALDLQFNITKKTGQPLDVYTFGAPRVGNSALVNSFRQRVPNSYRFVYGWDVVTRVPRSWQGFAHVPEEQLLGNLWTWQIVSRRVKDHQISLYVAALEEKTKSGN